MKKLIVCIGLFLSLSLFAQEATKIQEIGGTTRSLSSFGVTYRIGNTNAVWRFDGAAIGANRMIRTAENGNESLGLSLSIGREWRKPLSEMFELRYGLDLGFGYSSTKNIIDRPEDDFYREIGSTDYTPRINGVFGFNFIFAESLVLGFEVQPFVSYNFNNTYDKSILNDQESMIDRDSEEISIGASTNSVVLSLVYRFGRKK
jgi:hypothetical protein